MSAGTFLGAIAGGVMGLGQTALGAEIARRQSEADRSANYRYGEMAAENADKRTRLLYQDFYSPSALLRQYHEAGLSPSLMYGGTPGQGGMSGAQGSGANGPQTAFMPPSIVESALQAAQIANINAQTQKTEAETANINKDTDIKVLQEEWQTMINSEKFDEWRIFGSYNEDGSSLYDKASQYKDFESFLNWFKQRNGVVNEYERRALQKIYTASYYVDREIAVLTNETVSAEFYTSVTKALEKQDFADWNAQSTVEYLKQNVEVNKLTEKQYHAWNDLLERLEKRNDTAAQVLLVVGMIIDKALTQYRLPNIQTGGQTINVNKAQ